MRRAGASPAEARVDDDDDERPRSLATLLQPIARQALSQHGAALGALVVETKRPPTRPTGVKREGGIA